MHRLIKSLFACAALAFPARAGDVAGQFDYYILALTWSPNWCTQEGGARDDPQCDPGRDLAFTLHGLWPHYESGWPSDCHSGQRDPTRTETAAMADIMGSGGLAWYEWKKHGRCSGLSAEDYFAAARRAFDAIRIPGMLEFLDRDILIPPRLLEKAMIGANPGLTPAMLTITCKQDRLQELRLCLTRDLEPRECAADVAEDCPLDRILMESAR